jgi:hypothetical protein
MAQIAKFADCEGLEFVAHGPLEEEVENWDDHMPRRDRTHALERELCDGLKSADYEVMKKVSCRLPAEPKSWKAVSAAFRERFDRLAV